MAVVKVKPVTDFVCLYNVCLQEPGLSFKARGLWAYCMTLPENWEFNVAHLSTVSKEKRTAIYSCLTELIAFGYCERVVRRKNGKCAGVEYIMYGLPKSKESLPLSENLNAENLNSGNQPLQKKYSLQNKEENKNNGEKSPISVSLEKEEKKEPSKRHKLYEEYKEVAPRVSLTPSQEESIRMRLKGSTIDLNVLYDTLSVWKINKGIEGGRNDFKAICDWVIDAVKKNQASKPQDPTKENEELAKKVVNKFKKEAALGRMSLGYNYIDFTLGEIYEKLYFNENGFKEKIFNRLRKMNLPIDNLLT